MEGGGGGTVATCMILSGMVQFQLGREGVEWEELHDRRSLVRGGAMLTAMMSSFKACNVSTAPELRHHAVCGQEGPAGHKQ